MRQTSTITVVLLSFGLSACEPPALSLQEARKVAATFDIKDDAAPLARPPRSVADITAILNTEQSKNSTIDRSLKRLAAPPPPAHAPRRKHVRYHMRRGKALHRLGDYKTAVAEFRKALKYADRTSDRRRGRLYALLSRAQNRAIGPGTALSTSHTALYLLRFPSSVRISQFVRMARWLIKKGKIQKSANYLERAESEIERLRESTANDAVRIWARNGDIMQANLKITRGRIASYLGRLDEAEREYRSAIQILNKVRSQPQGASRAYGSAEIWPRYLAINLISQGRTLEAEALVRQTLISALRRTGRTDGNIPVLTRALSKVMSAQGRHAEAEVLMRAVLRMSRDQGFGPSSRRIWREQKRLVRIVAAQGRWADALKHLENSASTRAKAKHPRRLARSKLYALLLIKNGRATEAVPIAKASVDLQRKRRGPDHIRTYTSRGLLGLALSISGNRKDALQEFRIAVPRILEHVQRWHDSEESIGEGQSNQDQIIRIILSEYIDVLSQMHTDADPAAQKNIVAEGFKVAAYLEGSTIQRAMIENIARAAARSPELATLGRKEQNTRRQLVALRILYADILALPPGETDMGAIEDLRNRLSAVSDEHGRLSNELERQFPAYAELLNPKPATLAQARKFLGADEALIVTLVGEDKTYVWAVPKRGRVEFSAVPLGLNNIGEKVRTLRKALAPPVVQTLSDIPAFDVNLAHDLYKSLLAPVEKGWKSAKSLLVVASGPLGQLPFSLLVSEPTPLGKERAPLLSRYRNIAWLVRDYAVTVLPSVSTLITLRNKSGPTRARRAFIGFGDPLFSLAQVTATSKKAKNLSSNKVTARGLPAARRLALHLREAPQLRGLQSAKLSQLPRLPDTAAEIKEIALSLGADLKRDVYLGERASEDQVKNMSLADYKVVAFATHGLIPGDLDGLRQPALAMTSPEVIGGKNDGLLTMGEILSLKLDADWVVLSACNTSSGQSAGAEAVSGLGRAFFYAGTRALLVSHWPVETTSAKALTTDIFARQAKDTSLRRAAALRQSKLNLIDKRGMMDDRGRMVFSYAHPIFWAPFSIVGDGGVEGSRQAD